LELDLFGGSESASSSSWDNAGETMSQTIDSLTTARDAASRQSWREAFDAYAGLDQASLGAEDLERYGEAAWWSGKLREAVRLREEA